MAEENVGGIKFTVEADHSSVDKTTESMKRMEKQSDKLDSSAKQTNKTLDQGSVSASKLSIDMTAAAKGVGNVATAAVTASAALVGMVAVVADQVKEADNWSKALGITTTELQQLQAAAQKAGIDADKMGDILKDVNEKIGEAFVDGGGEGAEALKLLGLQVENIIDLPVDEKLKAIGDALQDIEGVASRSAIGEMLANDFTLILPLLEDGNAGLEEMMDRAMETGQALSSFDNTALIEVSKGFQSVTDNAKGTVNLLSAELAPAFIAVQEKIGGMIDAFKADDIETFVSIGVDAIAVLMDVVKGLEIGLRTIGVAWTFTASMATGAMAESAEAVATLINLALTPLRAAIATVADGWGLVAEGISKVTTGEVSAKFKSASDALKNFSKDASEFRITADDLKDANNAVNKSLDEQLAALKDLSDSPAYSDEFKQRIEEIKKEIEAKAAASDKEREASNKVSQAAKEEAKSKAKLTEEEKKLAAAAKKLAEETKKQNEENKRSAERLKDLASPIRVVQREYEEAKKLFEKGLITKEDFDATKKRLGGIAAGIGKEARAEWEKSGEDAAGFFSDAFADGIQSAAFSGGIEGAFDYLGSQLGQKVSDAVSKSVSDSVSSSIGNAAGGSLGGLAGGLVGGGIASLIGGLFGGSTKETLSAGFQFEIVDSQIAEAFSTERIKRSSIFGSSTREYKTAVSDATISGIQNSINLAGQDIASAASAFGVTAQDFSGSIKLANGSLNDAIELANDETASVLFAASEDWALAGESAFNTLMRVADLAKTVSGALEIGGFDASAMGNISAQTDELIEQYSESFNELMTRRVEIAERDTELIDSIGGTYNRTAATLAGVQNELKALFDEAVEIDPQLEELSERISGAAVEAAAIFNDELTNALAEIEGIPLQSSGARLLELSRQYKEQFFTAEELQAEAIESARDRLESFSDLGIGVDTSMSELRSAIEAFTGSDAFNAEGLARYLSATDALIDFNEAIGLTTDSTGEFVEAVEKVEDLRSLQIQLLRLQGDEAAANALALEMQKDGASEARIAMLDQIAAQKQANKEIEDNASALSFISGALKITDKDAYDALAISESLEIIGTDLSDFEDFLSALDSSDLIDIANDLDITISEVGNALSTAATAAAGFKAESDDIYSIIERFKDSSISVKDTLNDLGIEASEASLFLSSLSFDQISNDIERLGITTDDYAEKLNVVANLSDDQEQEQKKLNDLTIQKLRLMGDEVSLGQALELERQDMLSGLNDEQAAVLRQIFTLQDLAEETEKAADANRILAESQRKAAEEAKRAQEDINNQRERLLSEIFNLTASVAEKRQAEIDALHPSLRALQERIFAINDEQDAIKAATDAEKERTNSIQNAFVTSNNLIRDLKELDDSFDVNAFREMRDRLGPEDELKKQAGSQRILKDLIQDAKDRVAYEQKELSQREKYLTELAKLRGDEQFLEDQRLAEATNSNRHLIRQIIDLENANREFEETADEAARFIDDRADQIRASFESIFDGLNAEIDAVSDSVSDLSSISSELSSAIIDRAGIPETATIGAVLATARAGGDVSRESVSTALTGVRAISEQRFSSAEDRDFAEAVATSQIFALNEIVGDQLSSEEQTLSLLQQELDQQQTFFDAQLIALDAIDSGISEQVELLKSGSITPMQAQQSITSFSPTFVPPSVTIDQSIIANAILGLQEELRSALTQIASNTLETTLILDDATQGNSLSVSNV